MEGFNMGISAIGVLSGAIDTVQNSMKNLEMIQEARRKRQMEDEAFQMKKDEHKLNMKKMELSNNATEHDIDRQDAMFKQWESGQKKILAGKDEQIKQAEQEQATAGREASKIAQSVYPTALQEIAEQRRVNRLATSGNIQDMEPVINPTTGKMSLGRTKQKKDSEYGSEKLALSKQDHIIKLAKSLARDKVGKDVEIPPQMVRDFLPIAKDLYDSGGANIDDEGNIRGSNNLGKINPSEIKLPSGMRKASEIKKYLMDQGLNEEESINWIRDYAKSGR